MEFRNHQVWVRQRLATFQGRPIATFALVVVLLILIPVVLGIALIVLAIGIVATLVRAVLGMGSPRRVTSPPPSGSPTVIDVEVTRGKSES
ncbi:MAG: hypothetical protein JNL94_02505 [Planctomycetes bacterium]|nr:hypothetical protein [Planctomycetota bacterium]